MDDDERGKRLAVAAAADGMRRGDVSRRDSLRLCAQAGFVFSHLGWLSGCGRSTSQPPPDGGEASVGPQSAIDPATEQHRFLKEMRRRFSGTTLRVIGEETPPTRATIELMKQEFVPVTGIEVSWERAPLDRVLAKVAVTTGQQGIRATLDNMAKAAEAAVGKR